LWGRWCRAGVALGAVGLRVGLELGEDGVGVAAEVGELVG
jgi:hypothetical protein